MSYRRLRACSILADLSGPPLAPPGGEGAGGSGGGERGLLARAGIKSIRKRSTPTGAPKVATAYVGLGGNVGDVVATFQRSMALLAADDLTVTRTASLYRSRALTESGYTDEVAPYWNSVCEVRTALPAQVLLQRLLICEQACGRARVARWSSRTLDLDLLLYADQVSCDPALSLPHPRLHDRPFVLWPLYELDPKLVVPSCRRTVEELLKASVRGGAELLGPPQPWPSRESHA